MDGTLADVSSIRHHVIPKPPSRRKDFAAFHRESVNVPPHAHVVDLARSAATDGHAILVVTARSTKWRHQTAMWLAAHQIPSDAMFMRRDGDFRRDVEVKADILRRIKRTWTVVHAVDDNPAIIELWRSHNIETTIVPGWE